MLYLCSAIYGSQTETKNFQEDSEVKLVYIHGFNSAYDPQSQKIKTLSDNFSVRGITYDTFGHSEDVLDELTEQARPLLETE